MLNGSFQFGVLDMEALLMILLNMILLKIKMILLNCMVLFMASINRREHISNNTAHKISGIPKKAKIEKFLCNITSSLAKRYLV